MLPPGFRNQVIAGGVGAATAMAFSPDGRIFVCQQAGAVRVIKNGQLLATPFVSLSVDAGGERGLLGIAFDPAFAANQYIYLYYTAQTTPRRNRVSRFTASGDVAVPGSETLLLELEALSASNHNGGALEFGPDGALYVAVGDNAVSSNSQTLANRLGKVLRVNADGTVPLDNPFYNQASGANRAIWALGLRNPFTFAFQLGTDRMFINDVGQSTYEEVNDGLAGANYGWPQSEGPTSNPAHTSPIYWYGHDPDQTPHGCAITGGAFYATAEAGFPPAYDGDYFLSDFCGGFILRRDALTGVVSTFATGISLPVDLDMSPDGSLYHLARGAGHVGRVRYVRPQLASLTPSSAAPYPSGSSVTWTATLAPGSAGPVEYQFWLYSSNTGAWTPTAYGPGNTFVFTPTQPATYALQVWARNVGSAATWESYLASGLFNAGQGNISVTSLTPNQQMPPASGAPLTWTASSQGGQAPHTYRFWLYDGSSGAWTNPRSYDTSPSWTWTPTAAGTYAVQVWVRSSGSSAPFDAWRATGLFTVAPAAPETPRLVASPSLPVVAGTVVTWTARTSGGRQPTRYRFWLYRQSTGIWEVTQDWGASPSWSWRAREPGTYAVQVWVRSAGSSAVWQSWAGSGVFSVLTAPLTIAALTADHRFPVAPGSTVTWEAAASGGIAPLSYQFWGLTNGGWAMLRDYAPQSSVSWQLNAGPHTLQAWVRQAGSTAAYDSWIGSGIFTVAASQPTIHRIEANQTFPLPAETPIVWAVDASGGSLPLEYEFRRMSAGSWQVVQAWSSARTFSWHPTAGDAGSHILQVVVRSGSGGDQVAAQFGPFTIVE